MELDAIRQYAHRTDQIIITNDNLYSAYDEVVFTVNLNGRYKNDEIVRFSLKPDNDFLPHQRINDDYFFKIPNKVKSTPGDIDNTICVYVHYFPSDLYEYNEDKEILSVYDFSKISEQEYQSNGYVHFVDLEGRLIVQSLLTDSINNINDPNYKNYIHDNNVNANMTEQGVFPLSSKYRDQQNWIAPNLSDEDPIWEEENDNSLMPMWEAKIHRKELGNNSGDWDSTPINVYLNYDYLPTSREYHQHYFGFEPKKDITECKTINVFEGTNVNRLDNGFGSRNNYRIINWGNPYDDSKSFYIPHQNEKTILANNFHFDPSICTLINNRCDDFWIYTTQSNTDCGGNYCTQTLELSEYDDYVLRFFIYIPSDINIDVNCDSCYVTVKTVPSDKEQYWANINHGIYQYDISNIERTNDDNAIFKINDAFLEKDKDLRDQWVYHEIPFQAGEQNIIKIIGPQTVTNNSNNAIFFTKMSLLNEKEYSPTLKYTHTGLYVIEQDQYVYKPSTEEVCASNNHVPDNKAWDNVTILPQPYNQINITADNLELIKGRNNEIQIKVEDNLGNPITTGTITASILQTQNQETPDNNTLKNLKSRPIIDGYATWHNVDLSNLNMDQYYLRLKHNNLCYDISHTEFISFNLVEEELDMIIEVNGDRYIDTNNTITIPGHNYVIDEAIDENGQIINFPVIINAYIEDQLHHIRTDGYCELSINDMIVQTSMVDLDGKADFYLDLEDLSLTCQTIKIEYYTEYYNTIVFKYFNLCIDPNIDLRPAIPIEIKGIKDGQTTTINNDDIFYIDDDDMLLCHITTNHHNEFNVKIERKYDDGEYEVINNNNISNPNTEIVFFDSPCPNHPTEITYRITTRNRVDDDDIEIEDKYRPYQKIFKVIRNNNQ